MNITHKSKRTLAAALLSGGVAVAALATGTAQAAPGDNFSQPHQWCPGQSLPMDDVHWDNNICHTYYYVYFGQGNVAQNIWDGDNPPAPPPPPPPALINKDNCQQILGMFCPHA